MTDGSALEQVRAALVSHIGEFSGTYRVPRFLKDGGLDTESVGIGDPCRYFIDIIDEIVGQGSGVAANVRLGERDLIYLSFMRTFASLNDEVGTPLKQLAFLTHLRTELGVSVLICLPTGVIGSANRKGSRGSPFAVKNPFDVDFSMRDPLAPEVPTVMLYQALTQACQHLGMRAGSIVPMATLAIDSPLFRYFPELGYWWQAMPGERLYATETMSFSAEASYSAPMLEATTVKRFQPPPSRETIRSAVTSHGGLFVAQDTDGQFVTLANAYPDVLAEDAKTYTWEDVSPIRFADLLAPTPVGIRATDITHDLIQPALLIMAAAIAWRYCELGEQVMIVDVAPSVPDAVLETARAMCTSWPQGLGRRLRALGSSQATDADADRLLSELTDLANLQHGNPPVNDLYFIAEELWSFTAPSCSYQAITGPITPCISAHSRDISLLQESLQYHLKTLADVPRISRHLAGVSNHDTNPPTLAMSRRLLLFYSFLPASTPLIFSGSEWGFEIIVNREFGFHTISESGDPQPPATTSSALFNDCACQWDSLVPAVPPLHDLRQWVVKKLQDYDVNTGWSYSLLNASHPDCLGYVRTSPNNTTVIAVAWNFASVTRHAGFVLDSALDVLYWPPPYFATPDPVDLALIPAGTVAVFIGEHIGHSSHAEGNHIDGANLSPFSGDI